MKLNWQRLKNYLEENSESIKRKTVFLVLTFVAVFLFSNIVSSYKHNISDISLTIESRNRAGLSLIKVYEVSRAGKVSRLEKSESTWNHKNIKRCARYAKKIRVSLPKNEIENIKEIQVTVGKKTFKFDNKDAAKFKIIDKPEPVVGVEENTILELPDFVRSQTSLFYKILLFFSPISKDIINWGGDLSFLNGIFTPFFLFLFLFLFFFLLFRFDFSKIFHLNLVFFLTVSVVGFFAITEVNPHHDGIILKPALDVANGKMLFRDTFTQYGALTTLIQASALKLFGEYLIVIRLLTTLFYGLISILLWNIYSRILPKWLNTFSCIMWLFLGYFFIDYPGIVILPWPTVFAVFSILLSLYLLILFLEKQNLVLLFLTGVVSSLTFWFKINYGIISFLSIFSFLVTLYLFTDKKNAFKVLLVFFLGYSVSNGLFLGWLAINGALRDFILQSVNFAFAFSNNPASFSNEFVLIRIVKCLLQIGNKYPLISALWTILPITAAGVFAYSIHKLVIRRKILPADKIVLAISFVTLGLWLGYYPANALYHMYLSSVACWGLFGYLLWKTAGKLGITNKKIFVILIILSVSIHDLSFRFSDALKKISRIKQYERVEVPEFLSGMYVPKDEKIVHAEIWKSVNKFPYYSINLTTCGLYSLYKNNNKEFHKMYLDWGWVNSYLYPDYIDKLNRQIPLKSNTILSNNAFMIAGYVPVKVFPTLYNWTEGTVLVLLIPGNSTDTFKPANINDAKTINVVYKNNDSYRIGLKLDSNKPIIIDSVVVKVFTENNIPAVIDNYEFDYNVMPRILDKDDRQFVKELYYFDRSKKQYLLRPQRDKEKVFGLIRIFSNLFLSEKYSFVADTFRNSPNNKIDVYLNKKLVDYSAKDSLDANCSGNDLMELVVPIPEPPKQYIVRVRINYNGNYYQEKVIEKFSA